MIQLIKDVFDWFRIRSSGSEIKMTHHNMAEIYFPSVWQKCCAFSHATLFMKKCHSFSYWGRTQRRERRRGQWRSGQDKTEKVPMGMCDSWVPKKRRWSWNVNKETPEKGTAVIDETHVFW